jgi:hypothetical protein
MPGLRRIANREWHTRCSSDPAMGAHAGPAGPSSSLHCADRCGSRRRDRHRCCCRSINPVRRRLHLLRGRSRSPRGHRSSVLGAVRLRRECRPPRRRSLHSRGRGCHLLRYSHRIDRDAVQGRASLLPAHTRSLAPAPGPDATQTDSPGATASTPGVRGPSVRRLSIWLKPGEARAD